MKLFMGVQLIKMASVVASHTCAEEKKQQGKGANKL